MNKRLQIPTVEQFFKAVLSLENLDECYAFFEDVCTINEIMSISQRLDVAKMLCAKRTYLDISNETGASTATISRVNRSLSFGNDGYQLVLDRIAEEEN